MDTFTCSYCQKVIEGSEPFKTTVAYEKTGNILNVELCQPCKDILVPRWEIRSKIGRNQE